VAPVAEHRHGQAEAQRGEVGRLLDEEGDDGHDARNDEARECALAHRVNRERGQDDGKQAHQPETERWRNRARVSLSRYQ